MVSLTHNIDFEKYRLSTAQVAEQLDLDQRVVSKYCLQGKLDAVKVGRDWLIDPASVREYRATRLGRFGPKVASK